MKALERVLSGQGVVWCLNLFFVPLIGNCDGISTDNQMRESNSIHVLKIHVLKGLAMLPALELAF